MRAPPRPALVAAALLAASARAGSNLPADDPAWDALRDQIAQGRIADPLGGVQTLDRDRLPPPLRGPTRPDDAWVTPLERLTVRFEGADEHDRPYSLALRPRDLAGFIGLSCEYQEGRPCGDGAGAALELDSAAGWGELLTAATRLRASAGTASFADQLTLDRAYLKIESGPFLAQIGRDVIALGPSIRSSLMVSRNAVPQDGLRLQLHPVALPFAPDVRISLLYFIDRLREHPTARLRPAAILVSRRSARASGRACGV